MFQGVACYYCECFASFLGCLCECTAVLNCLKRHYKRHYIACLLLSGVLLYFKCLALCLDCFRYFLYIHSSLKDISRPLKFYSVWTQSLSSELLDYKGISVPLPWYIMCSANKTNLSLDYFIGRCFILLLAYIFY